VKPSCQPGEIIKPDGTCVKCVINEVPKDQFECKKCEDFTKPNAEGTFCVKPNCPAAERKFIKSDATCGICGEYEVTKDETSCHRQTCPNPKKDKLKKDGSCEACPDFKIAA